VGYPFNTNPGPSGYNAGYNAGYNPGAFGQAFPGELSIGDVMRQVYLWLAAGLALGFGISYIIGNSTLPILHSGILQIVALVGYLVVAFAFYPIVQRASLAVGAVLYLAFTALFGLLISSIWAFYATGPIFSAFVTTGAMFGIMSILGYTTKLDLSKLGAIFMMAIIGLIVGSLVNMFMQNGPLYWVLTFAGIVIFCGLTAYDTQWIRRNAGAVVAAGAAGSTGGAGVAQAAGRLALVGAFRLFMDFVKLFLFLLRIFGGDRL
jgi:FtsH-binding integral membrane protein